MATLNQEEEGTGCLRICTDEFHVHENRPLEKKLCAAYHKCGNNHILIIIESLVNQEPCWRGCLRRWVHCSQRKHAHKILVSAESLAMPVYGIAELVDAVFMTGGSPSIHWIKLCSGSWDAWKWSLSKSCEKLACVWMASCSCSGWPHSRYRSLRRADAQSCTCTSGILLASCMAGVTMFMLSRLLPNEKKMCPRSTSEHEVRRFRSSAFAILSVSRK